MIQKTYKTLVLLVVETELVNFALRELIFYLLIIYLSYCQKSVPVVNGGDCLKSARTDKV